MGISELLKYFRKNILFCTVMVTVSSSVMFPAIDSLSMVTPIPDGLDIHPFYQKYLDCDGLPVIGSERVDDKAFYRVQALLDKIFRNRPDIREAMVKEESRYIIIAQDEEVTDIPDYAHLEPKSYWDQRARGFGGKSISCGEENLLSLWATLYWAGKAALCWR